MGSPAELPQLVAGPQHPVLPPDRAMAAYFSRTSRCTDVSDRVDIGVVTCICKNEYMNDTGTVIYLSRQICSDGSSRVRVAKAMTKHMSEMERLFKALADATRLRILGLLLTGEVCVCHIHESLKIPQPKASRHLAYLRRAGLVETRDRKS